MNHEYYSLADVAKILRCAPYKIVYLLSTNQVPEPYRVGHKRLFSIEDIFRISQRMDVEIAQEVLTKGQGVHDVKN